MSEQFGRTSAGLREMMFDAIEKLRTGDMNAATAGSIAKLAAGICATVALEIDVAKLRMEYPSDSKLLIPAPLQMGVKAEPAK